jgi:hypothetical protein
MREHNWEESISTGFAPLVNTFISTLLLLQVPLLWNDEEEQQGRADSQRVKEYKVLMILMGEPHSRFDNYRGGIHEISSTENQRFLNIFQQLN